MEIWEKSASIYEDMGEKVPVFMEIWVKMASIYGDMGEKCQYL